MNSTPGRVLIRTTAMLSTLLALAACSTMGQAPATGPSLYERLGGAPALKVVVGEYVDTLATDPRTRRSFEGSNLTRVKERLGAMLCAATGGGCRYDEEDSIKTIHAGLAVTNREFKDGVAELVEILDRHHVPAREKSELLALLGPMEHDIVSR